jgi:hypothetical protein
MTAGRWAALVLLGAHAAAGQTGTRRWRPEERVVLRDFSFVYEVTATNDAVYAATWGGLIVYDSRFERWLPPVTRLDGFPDAEPVALLGDPADESLWIGTADEVVHYMPRLGLFERIAVPEGVQSLSFDRQDPFGGLYVQTPNHRWLMIPRGSAVATRVSRFPPNGSRLTSSTLARVLGLFPAVETLQATVLAEGGRRYHYTSAATDPASRNVFLGTDGLGLVRYDDGVSRLERLTFGLLADGVGAILLTGDGVWAGTTPHSPLTPPASLPSYVPGFTRISSDVSSTRWDRGRGVMGYPFREVRDMVEWDGRVWAGTDAGVVPLEGERSAVLDRTRGLPTNDVRALAVTPSGEDLWVGTSRGLVLLRDGGATVERAEATFRSGMWVSALAVAGSALWAGGPGGLVYLPDGPGLVTSPAASADEPLLRGPVAVLAASAGRLVMATRDRILWRNADGMWIPEAPFGELGRITALGADEDGVWIGGELGVQYFRFENREFLRAAGPGDLPGAVRDLAASDRYLWVGTENGLVRLEKRALGFR